MAFEVDYEPEVTQEAVNEAKKEIVQDMANQASNVISNPAIENDAKINLGKTADYIKNELASAVLKDKAVWQQDAETKKGVKLPVNPSHVSQVSGKPNFYAGGNAYLLMQKQFKLGTKDNRWMPATIVKNNKDGIKLKSENEKATCILAYAVGKDGKKGEFRPQFVYNYSQLDGVPKEIPTYDAERESLGQKMLEEHPFGPSGKAIGDFKDSTKLMGEFFAKAKKKFKELELALPSKDSAVTEQAVEKVKNEQMLKYEQAAEATKEAYAERVEAIKAIDPGYKGQSYEKLYLADMRKHMDANPDKKGYAIEAAKDALRRGTHEKTVEKLISALAPEAVRHGENGEYAKWVMDRLGKNKKFQEELDGIRGKTNDGKSKATGR